MSTQINITIGDQRLLQQNKTRAAANQQALDDRTATKNTQAAAAEQVTAQQEELPGAVPENVIKRRPAAQRKRPEDILIYAAYNIKSYQVEGSQQTANIAWNAPLVSPFTDQWDTRSISNVYAIETRKFLPVFANITKGTVVLQGAQDLTIPLNTTGLSWTVRQYFSAPTGSSQFPSTRTGAPPTFPFTWANLRFVNAERNPLRSCTPTRIYLSTYVRVNSPNNRFLTGISDPNAYDLPIFPARTTTPVPGAFLQKDRTQNFVFNEQVFVDYGIYHTVNLSTNTVQSRLVDVTQYSSYNTAFPAYNFYNNLNAGDPQYTLFRSYIEQYSLNGASENQRNIWARSYSDYRFWPQTLNYNPTTGTALVFADSADYAQIEVPPGSPPTERALYTATFDVNLTIPQLYASLPHLDRYTETSLQEIGFTKVKTVEGLGGFETVFPAFLQ